MYSSRGATLLQGGLDSSDAQGRASVRQVLCRRYIEQVAVALRGRERAVETIQALLRSCRAKTVSSAAAMHQASTAYLPTGSCHSQSYPDVRACHTPEICLHLLSSAVN